MECWEFRSDIKGRQARICTQCPYFAGRLQGKAETKVPCWEFQNCRQACSFHDPKVCCKTAAKPSAAALAVRPRKQPSPVVSAQQGALSQGTLAARKKNKGPKPISEAGYKLIAQTLRLMLNLKDNHHGI